MSGSAINSLRKAHLLNASIFQMQYVGLLLLLLVILSTQLMFKGQAAPVEDSQRKPVSIPSGGEIPSVALAGISVATLHGNTFTIDTEKLELIRYLLEHHDVDGVIAVPCGCSNLNEVSSLSKSLTIAGDLLRHMQNALKATSIPTDALKAQVVPGFEDHVTLNFENHLEAQTL